MAARRWQGMPVGPRPFARSRQPEGWATRVLRQAGRAPHSEPQEAADVPVRRPRGPHPGHQVRGRVLADPSRASRRRGGAWPCGRTGVGVRGGRRRGPCGPRRRRTVGPPRGPVPPSDEDRPGSWRTRWALTAEGRPRPPEGVPVAVARGPLRIRRALWATSGPRGSADCDGARRRGRPEPSLPIGLLRPGGQDVGAPGFASRWPGTRFRGSRPDDRVPACAGNPRIARGEKAVFWKRRLRWDPFCTLPVEQVETGRRRDAPS